MNNSLKTAEQLQAIASKMLEKSSAVSLPREGVQAGQSYLAHADYVKMPNETITPPQTLIVSATDGPKAFS